jgi:fatty-acyl-CoA synthase
MSALSDNNVHINMPFPANKTVREKTDHIAPAITLLAPKDNQSYVAGKVEPPLDYATIPEALKRTVEKFGDRDALIFPKENVKLSYKEFDQQVDDLAAGLLSLGLGKGDRLGIWSPNRLEWVITQFATARIGIILVTINPAYQLSEVEYALNKVSCKAIITAKQFKRSNYIEMLNTLAPELEHCEKGVLNSKRLPDLKIIIGMFEEGEEPPKGMLAYHDVMKLKGKHDQLDRITKNLSPFEPINIQFTSGTTGAPKGATLTHCNILNNARFVLNGMCLTQEDKLCIPVPLYHCFGMVMGTLACAYEGAAMVFPDEGFDAQTTLKALSKTQSTALYGVPTMFVALLEHPDLKRFDLSQLRTGVMAGAPCPIEVMKKVIAEMNMSEITICYGMTETSPISFQSSTDDPIERRVSTIGRVHPHVEVKVVDDDGNICAIGERGELWTRGYSVMLGYWDDVQKTEESIVEDGWMRTGDLATIDGEGYCQIVGRVKDMIIRGGENIYPREIEEYLFRHPKIQEVQVFGIPHEKYGEEVCTWIVPSSGENLSEEEVVDFCKGEIAHFKIPKHIAFVKQLPMTVTGKPQKFVMRDEMLKMLEKRLSSS